MTPTPASHADHDPLAIAAYAVGDATGSELDAAMALVAACPECALLHHDLRSIAAAMPALPAPVRNRDFRLTPGQAASLRPAGWRRILAPLAGPRFAFAGPLGTGLATLGLAGFLIAGAAGMPLAGSAAAPQDTAAGTAGSAENSGAYELKAATPSGDQERVLGAASMAPESLAPALLPVDRQQVQTAEASGVPVPEQPADQAPASAPPAGISSTQAGPVESGPAVAVPGSVPVPTADTGTMPFLPLLSGLILVVGLVLAGLRVAGRRLAG